MNMAIKEQSMSKVTKRNKLEPKATERDIGNTHEEWGIYLLNSMCRNPTDRTGGTGPA